MTHVLVAEDDIDDRSMMDETFQVLGRGDAISFVTDGSLVLDFLDKNAKLPIKLIVLDLNMPKVSGTEALQQLKSHPTYKDIPVIIFSSSINPTEQEKAMSLGAISYLTKPSRYLDYKEACEHFIKISEESV
jgi:CheY-like chemotaxis protein